MATHGTDMVMMWNMFPFEPMSHEDEEVSRRQDTKLSSFL